MGKRDDLVSIDNVVCKHATPKALLCEIDGGEYWIPQSQIHDDSEVYDDENNATGTLVIPEWLAIEKGLI